MDQHGLNPGKFPTTLGWPGTASVCANEGAIGWAAQLGSKQPDSRST